MNNTAVTTTSSKTALPKVLTLGYVPYGTGRRDPFDVIFDREKRVTPADIFAGSVDALVIWGGEDISPTLYNEAPNGAHVGVELSRRDHVEKDVCEAAIKMGIPIIGVCRGAQLLCAMAGGRLHQDVSGHHGSHKITTKDGDTLITSSIHHQMLDVRPLDDADYEMIAWSSEQRAKPVEKDDKPMIEPEIVYFKRIKGLAIQGHPEFMDPNCDFVKYTQHLINEYLLKEKDVCAC